MFRLTREVRFAINPDDEPAGAEPTNSHAGFPPLRGLGHYLTLRVTVAGDLDPDSRYLLNIREVDAVVRRDVIPRLARIVRADQFRAAPVLADVFQWLRPAWPGVRLDALRLALSPFLSFALVADEVPMVRLSQRFEFSASHRLHNPRLSDEQNRRTFGKCNNPAGHGHNYELQVTLKGRPDDTGLLIDIPAFERIVAQTVIDRFDHKNLNAELPEFRDLIPSVENIAMTIYRLLQPALRTAAGTELAAVTVWETPKTWCEYSEP